jgi:predicted transposase/invertase (TIGR01784 family)
MPANVQYKDTVFTKLFGNDCVKLCALYNALFHARARPTDILINTLDEVLFMGRRNDISFRVGEVLVVLIEHQSTLNCNMPLRFFIYLARIYEKIVDNAMIYKEKLLRLPRPEFIVLYNGSKDCEDRIELHLADAFAELPADERPKLDLVVTMLNINDGHNAELLNRSTELLHYAQFVAMAREEEASGKSRDEAIKTAVKRCIKSGILKDFLLENSSEVINMLTTEFDLDTALAVRAQEAFEDGVEKGIEKGIEKDRQDMARNFYKLGVAETMIRQATGFTAAQLRKIIGAGDQESKSGGVDP